MKYCVIIPAYNAAEHLPPLLERIAAVASMNNVLVVDDGSTDDTASVAKRHSVNVIVHPVNMGKGTALKTAFDAAIETGYDAVVTIDADLQHPPELIPELISPLANGADMVIGNRMSDVSSMPIERKASNFLSTLATSILARRRMLDSQCGFRAIRSWILQKATLFCTRYQLESELLIEAARMGAKIEFVDIPTLYNGNKSYFNPILDTARFMTFLLLYYPKRWVRPKKQDD